MPKKSQITLKEARQTIKSKEGLYEAMQRNRWYLPQITSTLITVTWMLKVKNGELYCPSYKDIKLLPCPKKPLKSHIVAEVLRILKGKNLQMDINATHQPDLEWCMAFISSHEPEHRYFKKDYLPSIEESRKYEENLEIPDLEEIKISNDDDFFTDLPPEQGYYKSRKSIFPVPPEHKKIIKLQNYQKTQTKLMQMKKQLEGFNFIQNDFDFNSDEDNFIPYEQVLKKLQEFNLQQKIQKSAEATAKSSQSFKKQFSDEHGYESEVNIAKLKSGQQIPVFKFKNEEVDSMNFGKSMKNLM